MTVHGRLRRLHVSRRSRFNFNKTKYIAVPPDQVDLTSVTRRSKVSSHHDIPETAQVEVSVFFSARTSLLVLRPFVGWQQPKGKPIQGSDDHAREPGGKQ
jgi:hypothetical protein